MSEQLDLDALIDRLREASTGVFNNTATADFLMNAASDALESTLAELRQERERADENADAAQGQNDLNRELGAALSRAEETIAAALAEQGETEWEWGVARAEFPSSPAYYQRDQEACERFIANPPLGMLKPQGPWLILRRRKAGPWMRVEQGDAS